MAIKKTFGVLLFAACVPVMAWQKAEPELGHAKDKPIQLLFALTDQKDRAVLDLQTDQINVSVDGAKIANVDVSSAHSQPLFFAILVDSSGSSIDKMSYLRDYSKALIKNFGVSHSKGILVPFNENPNIPASYAEDAAANAIEAINKKGTALFDAIYTTCAHLEQRPDIPPSTRKIIVLLTDGADNISRHTLDQAVEAALRTKTVLFAVGLVGPDSLKQGRETLGGLTNRTGGRAVILDRPGEFISKLNQFLGSQYLLTYRPSLDKVEASGFHRLQIEVSAGRKLRLSVPEGYFIGP